MQPEASLQPLQRPSRDAARAARWGRPRRPSHPRPTAGGATWACGLGARKSKRLPAALALAAGGT
jgi:hypothetical protein